MSKILSWVLVSPLIAFFVVFAWPAWALMMLAYKVDDADMLLSILLIITIIPANSAWIYVLFGVLQ